MIDTSFGSLIDSYLREATPFALVHALLLVACLRVWVNETFRIRSVRQELHAADAGSKPSSDSTLGQAFDYAVGLAAKGRLVDPGALQSFFRNAWQASDGSFHAFLNAFVISGILGTLYSLWRVRGVLQAVVSSSATAESSIGIIGVAFTASIFGLAFALTLSAADALIFQSRRDRLIKDAVEWLVKEAVERTPLSAEAILARSIDDLREFNKEVVQGVAVGLEQLAREYATRFDGLATKATGDLDRITAEWSQSLASSRTVLNNASTTVSQASERLDAKRESIETSLKTVNDAQALLIGSVSSVESTVSGLLIDTQAQVKASTDTWERIATAHQAQIVDLHMGVKKDVIAGIEAIGAAANSAIRKVADKEAALTATIGSVEGSVRKEADAGVQAIASATRSALKTVADSETSLNTAVGSAKDAVAGILRAARTEPERTTHTRRVDPVDPRPRDANSRDERASVWYSSASARPPEPQAPFDSISNVPKTLPRTAQEPHRSQYRDAVNESRVSRAWRRLTEVFGRG